MNDILLSIITINYNNNNGLLKTIESVINQSFQNFEYIIIDGGSTDASVETVKQNTDKIYYWVSEKDNGVYHAMNKGIKKANGKYVLFINSGDSFVHSNILEAITPLLNNEDIIYGDYIVKSINETWEKIYPQKLSFSHFMNDSLSHSAAAFTKRSAFKNELSTYDESLKIVSDWKWYLLAIFKHNYSYKHIDKIIGVFDFTGISATNPELGRKEKLKVFQQQFPVIYEEISELLTFKNQYKTLQSSKYMHLYLSIKRYLNWSKTAKKKPTFQ